MVASLRQQLVNHTPEVGRRTEGMARASWCLLTDAGITSESFNGIGTYSQSYTSTYTVTTLRVSSYHELAPLLYFAAAYAEQLNYCGVTLYGMAWSCNVTGSMGVASSMPQKRTSSEQKLY